MTNQKPEKKLEKDFETFALKAGCLALKFVSPQRRGVPDRLVLCPGNIHFFIEFKAPGETPNKLQIREHQRYRLLGHSVFVCDTPGEAEGILLKILSELRSRVSEGKPGRSPRAKNERRKNGNNT